MLLVCSYKKVLTGFLFFISLFITSISCDSTEPIPDDENNKWIKLNDLNGMNVKGFKIFKNELYVFGWGINDGLFKTNEGENC